jgi:hypothetical protein
MEPKSVTVNLGTWIHDHRVTWDADPWLEMVDHKPASIGFELRLFARAANHQHPTLSCDVP